MNNNTVAVANGMVIPQKIKQLLYTQAILLPITYLKVLKADLNRYVYTNVHRSIIHSNQKVEITQVSFK